MTRANAAILIFVKKGISNSGMQLKSDGVSPTPTPVQDPKQVHWLNYSKAGLVYLSVSMGHQYAQKLQF